jgi:hypothetical protein
MKITRENIEGYLIDYLNNELSSEDYRAVRKFLEDHPDLDPGKESLAFLPEDEIVYQNKDLLKKNIRFDVDRENMTDAERKEYLLFLLSENDLQSDQEAELKALRNKDGTFDIEARIAKMIQFKPENEILFPDKNELKRKSKKMRIIPWISFAAASILIAFLIWNFKEPSFRKDDQFGQQKQHNSALSSNEKNKKSPHLNSHSKKVQPEKKSQENFFNSTGQFNFTNNSNKLMINNSILKYEALSNDPGEAHEIDDSLRTTSIYLTSTMDSSKNKVTLRVPEEKNSFESGSFTYLIPTSESTIDIKRPRLSKKNKGVKNFQLRIGSFYFSYSKTLIEK